MQVIACWCAFLTVAQISDTEYAGPAYADRVDKVLTVRHFCKREAIILSVRAGLGPDLVELLFGGPALTGQFRAGPIEWWYPQLGVIVHWPPRLFKPSGPVERVEGSIQPN